VVEYGDNSQVYWHPDTMEARFPIRVDGKKIVCRATAEYLEDRFQAQEDNDGTMLDAARSNFDAITDDLAPLLAGNRFEPDGSILLRSRG
jgi:hypothetical protein